MIRRFVAQNAEFIDVQCSFDAFLDHNKLHEPALDRGADAARPGMSTYDVMYTWCRSQQDETHNRTPRT